MKKPLIILSVLLLSFIQLRGADLVLVINTLECVNYYRSAPLLNNLKENFEIRFIFPEYESKIAVKYLDEKFNLKWKNYQIQFNDSLYNLYRKNQTSECVYFPDNAKTPLISFPLSQLAMSFNILRSIPSKIKVDTIPVTPDFLISRDLSFSFDSTYLYVLDAQFGSILQLNLENNQQKVFSLPDSLPYEYIIENVLTRDEIKSTNAIEKELGDQISFLQKGVSFHHITSHQNLLYIRASVEYYKKDNNRNAIYTRNFIVQLDPAHFHTRKLIPLPSNKDFYYSYSPAFLSNDTTYLPVGFPNSTQISKDKKYLLSKYVTGKNGFEFIGFEEKNLLPEEYQRLHFNYNFLNYSTYKNYFSFPYTKTIYHVNGSGFTIKLLPDVDTLAGSNIPQVKTNYLKMSFAVEPPVTNFIAKFDDGTVKLLSYDYSNSLPFNQITLPVKINTLWPEEDFFKFTSIHSFVHINLRNQFIVKYHW
jgi:hypothetical protein